VRSRTGGARLLGLGAYGLTPGATADLVVLAARSPAEAVVAHRVRDLVIKSGRVIARNGEIAGR
jgi:cytosine deaminase